MAKPYTQEDIIKADRWYLKAFSTMLWGLALFCTLMRMASFANLISKPSIWVTNDLLVWPILVLLPTITGIGIWLKKKWSALLFALLSAIWITGSLEIIANSCATLNLALFCVAVELRLISSWHEKQLTW